MNEWIGENQKTGCHNFIWSDMLMLTTIKVTCLKAASLHAEIGTRNTPDMKEQQ